MSVSLLTSQNFYAIPDSSSLPSEVSFSKSVTSLPRPILGLEGATLPFFHHYSTDSESSPSSSLGSSSSPTRIVGFHIKKLDGTEKAEKVKEKAVEVLLSFEKIIMKSPKSTPLLGSIPENPLILNSPKNLITKTKPVKDIFDNIPAGSILL